MFKHTRGYSNDDDNQREWIQWMWENDGDREHDIYIYIYIKIHIPCTHREHANY